MVHPLDSRWFQHTPSVFRYNPVCLLDPRSIPVAVWSWSYIGMQRKYDVKFSNRELSSNNGIRTTRKSRYIPVSTCNAVIPIYTVERQHYGAYLYLRVCHSLFTISLREYGHQTSQLSNFESSVNLRTWKANTFATHYSNPCLKYIKTENKIHV